MEIYTHLDKQQQQQEDEDGFQWTLSTSKFKEDGLITQVEPQHCCGGVE